MSKKGLSAADKRIKMVELFHETKSFFSLKELEKLAPKNKGIVQQSVKEVIDDLVSDGLVNMDKIGTGNYYWAFPSATGAMKTNMVEKAQAELTALEGKLKAAKTDLKQADKGREDTEERQDLLNELQAVQEESLKLKEELAAFGAADPVKYERKKRATEVCKQAAGRWTDNVIILMGVARSAGATDAELREMLGISEEWDDLPQ